MITLRIAVARLLALFRRPRLEEELDAELGYHLDMSTADHIRNGLSPAMARDRARRDLGQAVRVRERWRDSRGFTAVDDLVMDLRHGIRLLVKQPGFSLAAVAALALGLGAAIAIFSVVNAVLLRPVPFPDSDRIVWLNVVRPGYAPYRAASPAKFAHWSTQTDVIENLTAFQQNRVLNYTGSDVPEQLRWAIVSVDYFRLFGASIIQGRVFTPQEDLPNGPAVAVISEQLWTRRFDRDPAVVGRTLSLSGEGHIVVGVVGSGFDASDLGPPPDVWTPMQLDPNTESLGHSFSAAGRLREGVSLTEAVAALAQSTGAYLERYPGDAGDFRNGYVFGAEPLGDALVSDDARTSVLVLMSAVGFLLLIACSNVASLLLVRAAGRTREIAIRTAIGSGRGRIVRQLLTESVLLSTTGGAVGLVLGVTGIKALLAVDTAGLPRVGEDGSLVTVDWRVLVFALTVSVGTGILFGLLPALQGSRADLSGSLTDGGGRTGGGFRQNRTRAVLVVSEVALALVLLVGSALLIRTSLALSAVDQGFDATNVLTMRMSLTGPRFATAAGVEALLREGVDRVRTIPGVEHAVLTCCVPLRGSYGLPFTISGRTPEGGPHGDGNLITTSADYFEVFKVPMREGRTFTDRDTNAAPPVVIINETMARRYWPDSTPLGARIAIGRSLMPEFADEPERQVIGVVADFRDDNPNSRVHEQMYVPLGQLSDGANALLLEGRRMSWAIRTRGRPGGLSAAIQEELRVASGLPVTDVSTMGAVVSRLASRERFNMLLMTVFGGAALLLAVTGLYGLLAYSVAQRRREIGIRLALGAETGQVRKMVALQGMRLVATGVVIGLAAAEGELILVEN